MAWGFIDQGGIIAYQFYDSKVMRIRTKKGLLKYEERHKPSEEEGAQNHDQKERDGISDLSFSLASPY